MGFKESVEESVGFQGGSRCQQLYLQNVPPEKQQGGGGLYWGSCVGKGALTCSCHGLNLDQTPLSYDCCLLQEKNSLWNCGTSLLRQTATEGIGQIYRGKCHHRLQAMIGVFSLRLAGSSL